MPKTLLTLVLAVVVTASSCGNSSTDVSAGAEGGTAVDDAAEVASTPEAAVDAMALTEVVARTNEATSARFESTMTITGFDPTDPEMSAELVTLGSFDDARDATEVTINMGTFASVIGASSGSVVPAGFEDLFTEPLRMITIGEESWLSWPPLAMFTGQVGAEDLWLSLGADEVGDATSTFGVGGGTTDPDAVLASLENAEAEVVEIGTETVRGVETRHLQATVDDEALAVLTAEAGDTSSPAADPAAAGDYVIDLWVGVDDGRLYRYQVEVPAQAVVGDDVPAHTAMIVLELFDYGAEVQIEAPPADQVVAGDSLLLP
jgi:hypothetical protein